MATVSEYLSTNQMTRRSFLKNAMGILSIFALPGSVLSVSVSSSSGGYGAGQYGMGKYGITTNRYTIFMPALRK